MVFIPKSVGKDKLNIRWKEGIWLGVREDSGESLVGTVDGVLKVRSYRRRAGDTLRWNDSLLDGFKGVPWEPTPGRDSIEPQIKIGLPEGDEVISETVEAKKQEFGLKRSWRIERSDVKSTLFKRKFERRFLKC